MSNRFSVKKRIVSFKHAFRGIAEVLRSQHNAWIHTTATVIVVIAGIYFQVTRLEWCWLVAAMAFVWVAEAFNTALENLADAVVKDVDPLIGKAKDIAAGAVLIAAAGAAIIGLLILGPYIINLISRF